MRAGHGCSLHVAVAFSVIVSRIDISFRHGGEHATVADVCITVRRSVVEFSARRCYIASWTIVGITCRLVIRSESCHGDDVSERSRISGHFLAVVARSEERHSAIDRIVEAKFLSVSVFEVFDSRIDKWLSGLVGLVREDCTCLEAP